MSNKTKKGICLSSFYHREKKSSDRYLCGVMAMLAFLALVLILRETTNFSGKAEFLTMLITGAYLSAMFVIMQGEKVRGWFYAGTLVLLLILVLIAGEQLKEGARLFWNCTADKWTLGNGKVLTKVSFELSESEHSLCKILFSAAVSACIALISCLLTSKCGWSASLLILLSLFVNPVVFKGENGVITVTAAAAEAVLVLACSGWKNRRSPRPATITSVISAVLAVALMALCLTPEGAAWGEMTKEKTHDYIHRRIYETGYGTLPEGKLSDYTPYREDAVPALVVTMDTPEVMYLRGFTGCTFENGDWESVENETLAENSEFLYWLNREEFNPAAQFEAAAFDLGIEKNTVTVQNLGACSAYLYVPYSAVFGSLGQYLVPENLNTDSIATEGDRTYIYSTLSGGTALVGMVLDNLQNSQDESVLNYRRAESAYRQYVYNTYLQVSPDMAQTIEDLFDDFGLSTENTENLSRGEAMELALKALNLCFSKESEETVLPLENIAGTSYRYATVATLVLRTCGIAARYAEGYVVSETMAQNAGSSESINVDSSCAKGWVEIYQDGIGWIPMELAPGLADMTVEEHTGKNTNSSSVKVSEGKELEEEPNENEPEPDPLGGSLVTISKAIKFTALIIIFAVLLLMITLVLRRKMLRGKREKLYGSENINKAVGWLFYDAAQLLGKMGFDANGGSMAVLSEGVHENFGSEYGEFFDEMVTLNGRALFSQKPMEEENRTAAKVFFALTAENLKRKVKRYKRFWLKWIRCLY